MVRGLMVWAGLGLGAARAQTGPEDGAGEEAVAGAERRPADDGDGAPEVVDVSAEDVAPGVRALDRSAVAATPVRSPAELFRALPGMQLSAHGGRGKAWQFLYRGFDAEHGADVAMTVDGVPLNEPSNVHGHGYLDPEVLPLRLIRGLTLSGTPDRASVGAFGVAASVGATLGLEREGWLLRLGGGTDRSGAFTVGFRPRGGGPGRFLLAEVDAGLGVTEARSWGQARLAAGIDGRLLGGHARAWVLGYHGTFASPGALREDDVAAGRIGLYEGYPGAGGGTSQRVLAMARVDWREGPTRGGVTAWADARDLSLRQNFTGFLQDPVLGDGTAQRHRAARVGLSGHGGRRWLVADHPWGLDGGLDLATTGMRQRIEGTDPSGTPTGSVTLQGRLRQVQLEGWAEGSLGWRRRLWVRPGLRVAGWWQGVADTDEGRAGPQAARWMGTVAPRVRVDAVPVAGLELFAGYGRTYRPPRAVGGAFGTLVTADGGQGGVRGCPVAEVCLTGTGFVTALSDEAVFDHVGGRFVGSGDSLRRGAELLVEATPVPHLLVEASATFAEARLVASGDPVPYAPRWMGSLSVGLTELPTPEGRITAGLRAWVVAPRPLPLGFVSETSGTASALLAWHRGPLSLGVQVDNLLGTRWRDGEFVYASWWDRQTPRSELPAIHLTAGTPTAAMLWMELRPEARRRPPAASRRIPPAPGASTPGGG